MVHGLMKEKQQDAEIYWEDELAPASVTHVVCLDGKRTIKVLRGLALGTWIVNEDWITKSFEAGKYLPEADFEGTLI